MAGPRRPTELGKAASMELVAVPWNFPNDAWPDGYFECRNDRNLVFGDLPVRQSEPEMPENGDAWAWRDFSVGRVHPAPLESRKIKIRANKHEYIL